MPYIICGVYVSNIYNILTSSLHSTLQAGPVDFLRLAIHTQYYNQYNIDNNIVQYMVPHTSINYTLD